MRAVAAWAGILAACLLSACRGEPPVRGDEAVGLLVDSLVPAVERATGLRFLRRPQYAVRSREEVRAYVLHKLEQELPPRKAAGLQATYRLLGLLPDTLDLRALLLELFTEQIVGYYEPDSSTLFVVANADPAFLRAVVAHELVHSLQHQHLPLDSIMSQEGNSDRLLAAQAILEGQATLAGLQVMVPDQNLYAMPEFWETYREQFRTQQAAMPVPYLAGADFLRWWAGSEHRGRPPYGEFMPVSTEQIIHPHRFGAGDPPVTLRFAGPEQGVIYEDVFGEFDMRVLAMELADAAVTAEVTTPLAVGWGGDRFRIYDSPDGPAMLWYIVWDDETSRSRWLAASGQRLETRRPLGYRLEIVPLHVAGRPASRITLAPEPWLGWGHPAAIEVVPTAGGGPGQGS
jgi:hypothetical protein